MGTLKTTVLAEGFHFLESPRWRDEALWMSDMVRGRVYRLTIDGQVDVVAEIPQRPSGLGFLPDGTILIASMRDRRLLRRRDGAFICHADLGDLAMGELNDMIVDRRGRAYVGSFDWRTPVPRCFDQARLILVTPAGKTCIVAAGLAFPNGCVITADQKRLVLAETFGHRLIAFDIANDGGLSKRRLFADLGDIGPDGICLDAECAIWVAATCQPLFIRVQEGGRITHRLKVPGRQAVACILGGPSGRTLFCLTVVSSFEDVKGRRPSAQVEIVEVDVPCLSKE
jgi:sugar lactone lactonase YvrE